MPPYGGGGRSETRPDKDTSGRPAPAENAHPPRGSDGTSGPTGWSALRVVRLRLGREDLSTLPLLEEAWRELNGRGDHRGTLVASAYAVLIIAAAYADFRDAPHWVSRLRAAQPAMNELAPVEQLVACGAIVSATVIVDTTGFDSPVIDAAVARALDLLKQGLDDDAANDAIAVARALLEYCEQQGQPDTFHRIVAAATRFHGTASIGPLVAGRYGIYEARCRFRFGAYDPGQPRDDEASALLDEAEALAAHAGLPQLHFDVYYARVLLAAIRNESASLQRLVERMHEALDYSRPNCVALYFQHLARAHLMHDRVAQAFEAAQHALRAARLAACVEGELRSYRIMHALALLASGACARAVAEIDAILPGVSGRPRAVLECTMRFAGAWQARADGSSDYADRLRGAMQQAQELNWPLFLNSVPRIAAQLAADALRFGFGAELAQRAITLRKLAPPADADDTWAWPICIYTLGRFELSIDGKPLAFSGKAQRKPLELLKLVLAHGPRGVDGATAATELWPELEGDASRNAFDVALHRLRKLLRHEDAVSLRNGRVVLDATKAWVDARIFELTCREAEAAKDPIAATGAKGSMWAQRLLHCYQGHFLAGEDAHWIIAMRERLRSALLRTAGMVGQALERENRIDEAILLYRRVIELDPLAEEFHRRLMLGYRAHGRIAEALDAYRRCRDLISITLGVEPSAATQAVYRLLKQSS